MRLVKFDRHLSLFVGYEWLEWRRYEENEMSFTWNKRGYKEVVLTCNVYLQKWLVKRITTMRGTRSSSSTYGCQVGSHAGCSNTSHDLTTTYYFYLCINYNMLFELL